jgi:endonuclease YncB( thermonuclease family)
MLLDESDLVLGDTVTCYFVGTKKTSIAEIGISIAEKPQFSLKYSVPA